jgi:hypothetical protein
MFGRTLVLAVAACGVAAALVEATWAEGGALVWLDDTAQQAVVAAAPFSTTDCVTVGGGCAAAAVPAAIPCPPGVAPGGICNGTGWCSKLDPNKACGVTTTWNPFDPACNAAVPPVSCKRRWLICGPTGWCSVMGPENGDPVGCGTRTDCVN